MRTIKFKFWCKGTSTNKNFDKPGWWTYPNYLLSKYHGNLDIFDSEDFIPCQYTGLKDKNGKEIYEGDIVYATKANSYLDGDYIVVWDNKKGRWAYRYLKEDYLSKHQVGCSGNLRCEVRGNIYENPELL